MDKQKCKITKWILMPSVTAYFTLYGVIVEHPKLSFGKIVRTSRLLSINFDDMIAETENSIYELI